MKYRNMVLGEAKKQGISTNEIQKMLGISHSTLYRLLDEPDKITRGQLKILNKYLKIPMTTLLNS